MDNSKRLECIKRGYELPDGTRVEGHSYVAMLAFRDRDTDRWYYVDRCEHCQHCEVNYSDDDIESELYPEIMMIGGSDALL